MTIELQVEARLNVLVPDTGGVCSQAQLSQLIQDGALEIIKRLKKSGDIRELQNFMKPSTTVTTLSSVTCTAADPNVFTKTSHGLENGDIVSISGMNECTELNGMDGLVVENKTTNTFELKGISADPAETTGGNVAKRNTTGNFTSNPVTITDNTMLDGDVLLVERTKTATKMSTVGITGDVHFFPCRQVTATQRYAVQDIMDAEFATAMHPVYFVTKRNELEVYPTPTSSETVRVWGIDSFNSLVFGSEIYDGAAGTNYFVDSYFLALVYYACAEVAWMYCADIAGDTRLNIWTPPTAIPRFTVAPVVTLDATLPTAPVYTPVPSFTDYASFETAFADDDVELSAAAAQKIGVQVQEYTALVQDSVSKFSAEAKEYDNELQVRLKNSEISMTSQVQDAQNQISQYATHVNAYAAEVQEQLHKMTVTVQNLSSQFQLWSNLAALYEKKFSEYMMNKLPAPAQPQAQGGRNAR
jgi:hypothetical protein